MDSTFLESFVFDKMAATGLPGLSLSLVKGDEVVYARGFGQRDIEQGFPATPETLYCIGSVTKSFTALATMQLVEQGQLSLDDPVSEYLSFDVTPRGEAIRLKHLLSHSTGIPALAYAEALLRHASGTGGRHLPIAGPEDIITFAAEAQDWVETAPGERWFYFNEGYAMLGQIIEQVSGQDYNDYVKDNILTPLGMTRSFFAKAEIEAQDDVTVPYVLSQNAAPRPGRYLYRNIRSEGGLISSVLDLSCYLTMYLEGGKGIASTASIGEMCEPRIPLPWHSNLGLFGENAPADPAGHYGYGLSTEGFYDEQLIGHGGSVFVATAHLAFLPQSRVGVALLSNGSGYPMSQVAKVALAVLLGKDPNQLPFVQVESSLSKLTGSYETYKSTMKATVSQQADFLKLVIHDLAQPQEIILAPDHLGTQEATFFTLAAGRKLPVTFRFLDDEVELIYERYKLRRTGPCV